jgi:hypothetical protein
LARAARHLSGIQLRARRGFPPSARRGESRSGSGAGEPSTPEGARDERAARHGRGGPGFAGGVAQGTAGRSLAVTARAGELLHLQVAARTAVQISNPKKTSVMYMFEPMP